MLKRRIQRLVRVVPLVLARIAGAGLTGGLAVYVARTQGAKFSGRFFLLISTITILSVLTRLGVDPFLSATVAPRAADGVRATATHLVSTSIAVLILVAGAGLVLTILQLVVGDWTAETLGRLPVGYLILAVLGVNSIWIVGGYCRALGLASLSIFLETGMFSAWLFGILEVCRISGLEPAPTTVAYAVALLLPVLLLAMMPVVIGARGHLYTKGGWSHALRGLVAFGAVTVTNGIVILIPLQVLGWYGLVQEAGIYNAALRVSMFVGAFGVVIKSTIVRQEAKRLGRIEDRARDVRHMFVFAAPWVVVSLLIAWQSGLLSSLFGSEFKDIESIILIMLLAQCLYVAGNILETRAVLNGEKWLLNVTSVTTVLAALALTPPLVREFGLLGAAWGFAATIVVSRGLLIWMYLRPSQLGGARRGVPDSEIPSATEASHG